MEAGIKFEQEMTVGEKDTAKANEWFQKAKEMGYTG